MEWPDGRHYKGEYLNDKRHGFGVFKWPNGRIYTGPWVNGRQHGLGFIEIPGKPAPRQVEWANGKRVRWVE